MGFETGVNDCYHYILLDFEAVPMGFETKSYFKLSNTKNILKQSLWDLKPLSCIFPFVTIIYFEAVPMGFETRGRPRQVGGRSILKQSLWDLKLMTFFAIRSAISF